MRRVSGHSLPTGEEDTFTNGTFLCKFKFPLQKENLCSVFRDFPASSIPQMPSAQNNIRIIFEVAYSVSLQYIYINI